MDRVPNDNVQPAIHPTLTAVTSTEGAAALCRNTGRMCTNLRQPAYMYPMRLRASRDVAHVVEKVE
jgi:hypothetical protein